MAVLNTIEYLTIASLGNSIDFGDLTVARSSGPGCCSDGTKGVWGGGQPNNSDVLDYVNVASTGNASDFGDLEVGRAYVAAVSNGTKGVWAGGDPTGGDTTLNSIEYVTIATLGDASDFGDLVAESQDQSAASGD